MSSDCIYIKKKANHLSGDVLTAGTNIKGHRRHHGALLRFWSAERLFSRGKTEKESGHFCSCHAGWNCRGLFLIALAGQCPEVSPAKHQSIWLPQLTGEATKLHFILSCSIYLGLFFLPFCFAILFSLLLE